MIKTVSLTADTETKVEISGGYNVGVINRTTDMLYASKKSGISAGADNVAAIPAGDSYVIRAADDTVYLLATAAGDVQLESIGVTEVFKIAAARSSSGGGEGGTVDDVARQAIASHANNDEIHLTAEKAIEAAATTISNPNLLINSWFGKGVINQRGLTEYPDATDHGYTIDRWRKAAHIILTLLDEGIKIYSRDAWDIVYQPVDNCERYAGNIVTLSVGAISVTNMRCTIRYTDSTGTTSESVGVFDDNRAIVTAMLPTDITDLWICIQATAAEAEGTIQWAKLELGSVATPFVPSDPATELAKCQRYYIEFNPFGTNWANVGDGAWRSDYNAALIMLTLPVPMRIANPSLSVTGNWAITNDFVTSNDIPVTSLTATYPSNNSIDRVFLLADVGETADMGVYYMLRAHNDPTARLSLSAEL